MLIIRVIFKLYVVIYDVQVNCLPNLTHYPQVEEVISTLETVMSSTETWPLCLTLLSDTLLLHHSNPGSLPGKVRSVAKKLLDINISSGSSLSGR